MEFLALVTTGRRLREVLAEQVDRLDEEQRQVDRELLRLVCATHALGFETLSDTVPTALGRSAGEVESALRRLLGEHLITHIGVGGLRGCMICGPRCCWSCCTSGDIPRSERRSLRP
ncbi:hypothetical protein ACFQ0M_07850 [Kitasatospora aburaviensis]